MNKNESVLDKEDFNSFLPSYKEKSKLDSIDWEEEINGLVAENKRESLFEINDYIPDCFLDNN